MLQEELIGTFISLSESISKKRVVWRYDPIIISDIYMIDYHTERFSYMAKRLSNYTERYDILLLRCGANSSDEKARIKNKLLDILG